jgi:hypothetical protein
MPTAIVAESFEQAFAVRAGGCVASGGSNHESVAPAAVRDRRYQCRSATADET